MKSKYSCYFYGEGRKDKNFLQTLIKLDKFKYYTPNWVFNCDNSSGGTAETIIKNCKKMVSGYSYDLVMCFIDLDLLKADHPRIWRRTKKEIEKKYPEVKIIWQVNNLEEEIVRVIGDLSKSKHTINKLAKEKIKKFINSNYWKRIIRTIQNKELILQK